MRCLPVLLVWVISLLLPSTSNADFVDCYFHLKCSPSTNQAHIIPFWVHNKDVYSTAHKECRFKNGRVVRVKMGQGPAYPYGQDGAIPEYWFSMWVDKAKVLSRVPWGFRITATKDALKICGIPRNTHDIPEKRKRREDTVCKMIPNSKLHKLRDRLEYPSATDPIPPKPGTIVTMFAKDKKFCESFQRLAEPGGDRGDRSRYVIPPIDAVSKWGERISQYEYCGHYRHFQLDINNDGHPEHVVVLHSRTHYRDGDVYFVYNKPPEILQPSVESKSEFRYASKALVILPHNWSYPGKVASDFFRQDITDDGYYSFKSSGSPWWDSTDEPQFRFRYWHLSPFRLNNVTYFLTESTEADKSHWYGVLRPEPNGSATEMCLFQLVRDRY